MATAARMESRLTSSIDRGQRLAANALLVADTNICHHLDREDC
jgi:hypothetical protein